MAESEPAVGLPSTRATDGSFEQQHIVVVTPLEPRVRQDLVHRRTSAQFGSKSGVPPDWWRDARRCRQG